MDLKKGQTFTFRLGGLQVVYLDHIKKDLEIEGCTKLMKKIISEYIVMKHGIGVRDELRRDFVAIEFEND